MAALEGLARADVLAFDKTGTLTAGRPSLAAVRTSNDLTEAQSLRIAATLSGLSEHPLAKATRAAAAGAHLPLENGENAPGSGVSGRIGGKRWAFGKPAFVAATLGHPAQETIPADLLRAGYSVSVLGNSRGAQALLAFVDELRPGARDLAPSLADLGIAHVALLSGDNRQSVDRLAADLGLGEAQSGLSPQDKLSWLRARQGEGHRVVMIGDGINDAPTLAAADASVSLADATDLAGASSDFLLLNNQLSALAPAIRLARQTRRVIRQNLAWAAAYNLLAVPLAAAGLIPPWAAALGMSASSLLVVLNALRPQKEALPARWGANDSAGPRRVPTAVSASR